MVRVALVLSLLLAAACGGNDSSDPVAVTPPSSPHTGLVADGCAVAGCSGEVCTSKAEAAGLASACVWLDEYACYRTAACEPQADGACGWTMDETLTACIDAARSAH